MWEGLLCFQHCEKGVNVFCTSLPSCCPICRCDLSQADLRIPPFRIPSPFVPAERNPHCLVIKPSVGNFLRDFKNGDLLHAGLTNSQGQVYEYDENGLRNQGHSQWSDCLAIKLQEMSRHSNFDSILEESMLSKRWTTELYNEVSNNCCDYVSFVMSKAAPYNRWDKARISQELISPALKRAIKLISINRKVEQNGGQYPQSEQRS